MLVLKTQHVGTLGADNEHTTRLTLRLGAFRDQRLQCVHVRACVCRGGGGAGVQTYTQHGEGSRCVLQTGAGLLVPVTRHYVPSLPRTQSLQGVKHEGETLP